MRSWELTEAEFFVLWKDHTDDVLPIPISFTSRAEVYEDFVREKATARARLDEILEPALHDAVRTIIRSDFYIVVTGWDESRPLRHEGEIRVLAARQGAHGYTATQAPGESFWLGGGITITECDPLRLADKAVAALPDMAAGKRGHIAITDDEKAELDYNYGSSAVHDSFSESVQVRAKNFIDTTAIRAGQITIAQGQSIFGPRGLTEHKLRWRDIDNDGRYVITDEHPPVAVPADTGKLTAMINSRSADIVRAIKEERAL
ncbi:ESX secretion-associated protein EspG [Nocardia thraciensis]